MQLRDTSRLPATLAMPAPPPAGSAVSALLTTFFANLRRLLWIPGSIMVASVALAVLIPVRTPIEAKILVTQGPEYTFQPTAGEPATVSQPLEHDQTMHTEAAILETPDLGRATLRAIGVGRLYPSYVENPGPLGKTMVLAHQALAGLGLAESEPAPDPTELALDDFQHALTIDVPKTGGVIAVTFKHKDAKLGAEALNKLLALYIERRSALYRDDQSGIVAEQVELARTAMQTAEHRLAAFRTDHQAGGFDAQREILLRRRGDLESDRNDAQSQAAQFNARLDQIEQQLPSVPDTLVTGRDTDMETRLAPVRTTLEQLRAQYANWQRYRPDAPLAVWLRGQIADREAEMQKSRTDGGPTTVRSSQNPTWLALQEDRVKTETNLAAQRARLAQDTAHLVEISQSIADFDSSEQQLNQLQLQRALAEDAYRSAAKTLQDRRMAEQVEAQRRATVRVMQPAIAPVRAPPTRKLILAAGAMLALFGLAGGTLLVHGFSDVYWRKEAIEQDLGIAVLATFHEPRSGGDGLRPA